MRTLFYKYLQFLSILLLIGCATDIKPIYTSDKILPPPYYTASTIQDKDVPPPVEDDSESLDVATKASIADEAQEAYTEDSRENKSVLSQEDPIINPTETEHVNLNKEELLDTALELCSTAQELWSQGNPEKAIDSLDEAYRTVLKIDTESYPELIRQTEDLRFMISKRILEIYTSRYTTVNGSHKEIPLTMNEHVEREIKSFQGYEKGFFNEALKRSGRYREAMAKALKEAGMPEELSWLPLVESWFKVNALSPARALGLWQFIPSTGYRFGLKRDNWIDERLNPQKSTMAAIAYLKELHRMFGDWTTVLAAYNCGEGNVLRVIRQQKINYLDNFWDLYQRLPRETARYVPRFLAALHIMQDPAKYGFSIEELESPPAYETVTIEKQIKLKDLAEVAGIPSEIFTALNPELRRQATPPSQYSLNVPAGTGHTLLAKLDSLPTWTPSNNEYNDYTFYTVKKGDTLSRIAAKHRTSVDAIVKANNISRKRNLRIGQKLRIPLKMGSELLSSSEGKYRTGKGETLKNIAKKFNTNTTTLKKINNLTSSLLYEGQIIKVTE